MLGSELSVSATQASSYDWSLTVRIYVIPTSNDPCVIPFHWCEGTFEISDCVGKTYFEGTSIGPLRKTHGFGAFRFGTDPPPRTLSHTIEASPTEVLILGPGYLTLRAKSSADMLDPDCLDANARIVYRLRPASSNHPSLIELNLESFGKTGEDDESLNRWRVGNI